MIKRLTIITIIISLLAPITKAETADDIIKHLATNYSKAGGITADITIFSLGTKASKGSVKMKGKAIALSTAEAKMWYDGKDQWSFSTLTNEVNLTHPTLEELEMSHPYYALLNYKKNFTARLANSKLIDSYVINLTPRTKGSDIKSISITVNKNTYRLTEMKITTSSGDVFTSVIKNYKTGVKLPVNTFKFNKADVPAGTPIVDLR